MLGLKFYVFLFLYVKFSRLGVDIYWCFHGLFCVQINLFFKLKNYVNYMNLFPLF